MATHNHILTHNTGVLNAHHQRSPSAEALVPAPTSKASQLRTSYRTRTWTAQHAPRISVAPPLTPREKAHTVHPAESEVRRGLLTKEHRCRIARSTHSPP